MSIPTFREVQDDITAQLRDQGFLAAILVDLGPLAHIERAFGGAAFRSLRAQVDPLLVDMRERFRQDDFITRDEREGDRFLLFLSGPRRGDSPFRSENLRKLVERVEDFLNPRVGRLTLPYLRERPTLVAGYGLAHGIIGQGVFSAAVIMVLVTTMVTPPLLRLAFPKFQGIRKDAVVEATIANIPEETQDGR